jgi:hypothetical protein
MDFGPNDQREEKALDWRTIHKIELQYAKDFSIPS